MGINRQDTVFAETMAAIDDGPGAIKDLSADRYFFKFLEGEGTYGTQQLAANPSSTWIKINLTSALK